MEDAAEQAVAPDEHHDRGGGEEDAEGDEREPQLVGRGVERELRLAWWLRPRRSIAIGIDDGEEGDRADRRADEDGRDGARRAERRTDERHQRHVAHPHRLAAERRLAEPADDGDESRAGAGADERVERTGEDRRLAEEGREQRAGEHRDQPRDREAVGDEVVLQVGERDAEEERDEEREAERGERRAVVVDAERPQDADAGARHAG